MIVVIADDLTGAAELGGIGLRHGLKTEIRTNLAPLVGVSLADHARDGHADLLIIAADSRSKPQPAAIEEMTIITKQIKQLRPEWIYKKTDSVLRGHVIAELNTHLEILDLKSALLVPANPTLGRTIRDGHYYLHDKPIHHSAFSIDPEFPIKSSDIQHMLQSSQPPVQIRKPHEELPENGITVGEVHDAADLKTWAGRLPRHTLPAGTAGFFSALLDLRIPEKPAGAETSDRPDSIGIPRLFISGTTFDQSREAIKKHANAGGHAHYLPEHPDESWYQKIASLLETQQKAIIAIDPDWHSHTAHELRVAMAKAVNNILKKTTPKEIIIEGGATAYAILQTTDWHTFIPVEELAPGLVRMRVAETPDLFVTVKPGSYPWPETISYY